MENKYIFKINIGKISRKNGIQIYHSFIISTNINCNRCIENYYSDKYEGFDVNIEPIEDVIIDKRQECNCSPF